MFMEDVMGRGMEAEFDGTHAVWMGDFNAVNITVAHYRLLKAWTQATFSLVVILLPAYFTFVFHNGDLIPGLMRPPHQGFLIPIVGLAWFADIFLVMRFVPLIKQLVFDNARAVWIENGILVFVRPWIFSVNCNDIVRVTPGIRKEGLNRFQAVVLALRNGETQSFPTGSLKESREAIIAKLNEVLHLAK
jgi:hypothetical protein